MQALIVALSSGVVATVLFFKATDLAQDNHTLLAAVEATQLGEVVFSLVGSFLFIPGTSIHLLGLTGLLVVVLGMIFHSLLSSKRGEKNPLKKKQVI